MGFFLVTYTEPDFFFLVVYNIVGNGFQDDGEIVGKVVSIVFQRYGFEELVGLGVIGYIDLGGMVNQ